MDYFLRAPEPEDLDLLFRLENDPTVWTVSSCHMPYSRYALKQYILTCQNDFFAEKQLRLMVQPAVGGQAEAIEFVVPADAAYLGIPLSRLTVDPDSLVAVIVRGTKVIVPFGSDEIEKGDHVVAVTKKTGLASLGDILKL